MNYETRHLLIMVMETMPIWIDISQHAAIEKFGINRETHALPPGVQSAVEIYWEMLHSALFGNVRYRVNRTLFCRVEDAVVIRQLAVLPYENVNYN